MPRQMTYTAFCGRLDMSEGIVGVVTGNGREMGTGLEGGGEGGGEGRRGLCGRLLCWKE